MFNPNRILVAGLLATLGFAATAQTAPAQPAPGAPSVAPASREGHGRFDRARMQERMSRYFATFKQKLQLSPGQEAAWNSYLAALQPTPMQRPDRAEIARLSTPERIDRMRTLRAARMAEMDKRGDATKTLYAALTPEQKKTFDAETLRRGWGHHAGRGGHHGHERGDRPGAGPRG